MYATRKGFSIIEWLDLFGQENLIKSALLRAEVDQATAAKRE